MITGVNESKTLIKYIYHVNVNVNLMEQNVIQINDGIVINVNFSVKSIVYAKNIMFGIPLHVVVTMEHV